MLFYRAIVGIRTIPSQDSPPISQSLAHRLDHSFLLVGRDLVKERQQETVTMDLLGNWEEAVGVATKRRLKMSRRQCRL